VATPVIIVLAIVAMTCLVAIFAVVSQLVARLGRLKRDLQEIERDVMPVLDRLQRDAAVTTRELERLGDALDRSSGEMAEAADLVAEARRPLDSAVSDGPLAGPDQTRQETP
jgi:ABC-type transporter Mla subunit MlaD